MPRLDFGNGLACELATAGDAFLGIGQVEHHGLALRAAHLPWTIYAESETGVRFADFHLVAIEQDGETRTLVLRGAGSRLPRIQEGDAMADGRIRTRRLAGAEALVRWRFRPLRQRIQGQDWDGLAWTVSVESPGHPLHWLLEESTWEIGGAADGCTLIQRDMSTIWPEQPVRRDGAFSTTEKFALPGWGGSYPMDMMPRGAGSSHLDFQSKGDRALVLFSERPSLTRSRIDKFAGEDVIHYLDRPFFPLGERVEAPERTLLVHRAAGAMARHERRNLWHDVQAEVRDRILAGYGMRAEVVTPTVSAHLWDAELKQRGADWRLPLIAAFPELARLGWDTVYTFGPWESVTSDPVPREGCICNPYAFRFAERFGGAAGMREMAAAAHAAGLRLSQWFCNHLSKHAPVFAEHPDWILREPTGDPYDASYHSLWTARMRSGWGAELERQIHAVRQDTGLDGIFWDSFHNLGVTAVDWGAPDKAPQAEEIFRLMGRLQQAGFASQRPETVTIFGCGQAAVYGFDSDRFRRRLWSDSVANDDFFALIDTVVGFFSKSDPCAGGLLTADDYFRLAAQRVLPAVKTDPWHQDSPSYRPGGASAEAIGRINRQYRAALPRMVRPRQSADGSHVLWLDATGRPAALWALADGAMPFAGRSRAVADGTTSAASGGSLRYRRGDVLFLESDHG